MEISGPPPVVKLQSLTKVFVTDEVETHALAALGRAHPAIRQRQLDVLEHAEVANQVEALKDEPDLAVANLGALGSGEIRDRAGVEGIRAARRRIDRFSRPY